MRNVSNQNIQNEAYTFFPQAKVLKDFPYTPQEQIELAALSIKLSIQGMQPKLNVKLNSTKETFEMVERGKFYFKASSFNL